MKKTLISITLLSLSCFAQAQQTVKLQLYSNVAKADAPVEYALPVNNDIRSAVVTIDGKELPSQLDDLDGDGIYDKLAFVTPSARKKRKQPSSNCIPKASKRPTLPAPTLRLYYAIRK